jgi:N-methylhydantoinase A
MIRSVKAVSTQRGRDVRDFTLIAFGGSGPVHAVQLAQAMGITRVVVPLAPGLFSAVGLLLTDIEHDFTRTYLALWSQVEQPALSQAFRELEEQAAATLGHEGLSMDQVSWRRAVDMRYRGQSYALTIPLEEREAQAPADAAQAFETEHERTYGHRPRGAPVELVSLRLRAIVPRPRPALRASADEHRAPQASEAWFGEQRCMTPVWTRDMLGAAQAPGPLLVEQYDSVIVVPPGSSASRDAHGNVHVAVGP